MEHKKNKVGMAAPGKGPSGVAACPESPPVLLGFRDHSDEGCGIFHGVEVLGILIFLTVLSFGSQEAS